MRPSGALRTAGVILAVLFPSRVFAQGNVVLTVSGGPVAIPAPAIADYNNGFVLDANALSYNVNIAGGPPNTAHTTIVTIRSASATFGPTALSNFQWSRSDVGTWNSLTTSDVTVETRQISRSGAGNNWTNSLLFRCLVGWTNTPPSPPAAAYTTTVVLTLTVTTP